MLHRALLGSGFYYSHSKDNKKISSPIRFEDTTVAEMCVCVSASISLPAMSEFEARSGSRVCGCG